MEAWKIEEIKGEKQGIKLRSKRGHRPIATGSRSLHSTWRSVSTQGICSSYVNLRVSRHLDEGNSFYGVLLNF
ncbi:unnamed protein product [Camellia sinensis]